MGIYAAGTKVRSDRSKAEIERTLVRYGAQQFASGWRQDCAMIGFIMHNRQIRFVLPIRPKKDFEETPSGRTRNYQSDIDRAWDQDIRQRWRALALAIKAKLEAVESGITTFEEEFLAHIVLPDGKTYGEFAIPQIASAYQHKKMPPLLGSGQ